MRIIWFRKQNQLYFFPRPGLQGKTMTLYKTGQEAPRTQTYTWVKYTDGTTIPSPTSEERKIPLSK